jgi:hypothetical protein
MDTFYEYRVANADLFRSGDVVVIANHDRSGHTVQEQTVTISGIQDSSIVWLSAPPLPRPIGVSQSVSFPLNRKVG